MKIQKGQEKGCFTPVLAQFGPGRPQNGRKWSNLGKKGPDFIEIFRKIDDIF